MLATVHRRVRGVARHTYTHTHTIHEERRLLGRPLVIAPREKNALPGALMSHNEQWEVKRLPRSRGLHSQRGCVDVWVSVRFPPHVSVFFFLLLVVFCFVVEWGKMRLRVGEESVPGRRERRKMARKVGSV